jgi:pilus assembly protein CpaB
MNNRAVTLSLVMACLAVYFVYSYVESVKEEVKNRFGDRVLVVKAKRDIKEQETINETMLKIDVVPDAFLEPGAVKFDDKTPPAERTKGLKQLVGTVALVPVKANEQITWNKLTEPSIRTGLSPQVTPGRRAIAVPVNEISGVGKLVKPGDRVDLIAVIDPGTGKNSKLAKTILQDVVVLSVGKNVTNNVARIVDVDQFTGKEKIKPLSQDSSFASITLEVDPSQAQLLALVLSNHDNTLTLSLRNNDDSQQAQTDTTTIQDLLGQDAYRLQQRVPAGGLRR